MSRFIVGIHLCQDSSFAAWYLVLYILKPLFLRSRDAHDENNCGNLKIGKRDLFTFITWV